MAPLCVVLLLALDSASWAQEAGKGNAQGGNAQGGNAQGGNAQADAPIDWKPGQKLDWKDFKGGKPADGLQAETMAQFVTSWHCRPNGTFDVDVKAQFDPKESKVDPDTTKQTPELLAHEQLHFDIAQKHAIALKKALAGILSKKCKCKMSPAENAALTKEIDTASQAEADAMEAEQKKYDDETDHGDKDDEQKKWSQNVGKDLSQASQDAANAAGDGSNKAAPKAGDKPADKANDDKSSKPTQQGENQKKSGPKKNPGDSSFEPPPFAEAALKPIKGAGPSCPPPGSNTGYYPGTPGQYYATMIPGYFKPGENVTYGTPSFATDSEVYCTFGEGTGVPGDVTASNDNGDYIPPSMVDRRTPGTPPRDGPAMTPKPSDTPTPQMTEPKTASTPSPSPSQTPTASTPSPTPTETPVAKTDTPTPTDTPQRPTDTPTPIVPTDEPPVQITIFIKASEEVLTGGENGPPIEGQVVKLVMRDKPDLPTTAGDKRLTDTGFDKPAPQCTTGAGGGCKIDVPAEDRPLYALDKAPRLAGKPVTNFRLAVNIMKHDGGVAETTGKKVPDLKDALTAANATAEVVTVGARTFLRLGFNVSYGSTEELAKKFSELLGVPVEIDICLVKEPGPPLGSEPVSYAAINQELPNATIALQSLKRRTR